MGKKGEAGRSFAVLGRGGRPVTKARLCAFLAVGFVLGLSLGFIFMGTAHAVSLEGVACKEQPHSPAAAARIRRLHTCFTACTPAPRSLLPQFLEVGATKHHGQEEGTDAAGEQRQASAAGGEQQQDGGGGGSGSSGGWPTEGDTVHILYTSNGSPYTNYQASQPSTHGSRRPGSSSSNCCTRVLPACSLLWLDTCKAFWRRAIAAMLCCADSAPLYCTARPARLYRRTW